MKVLITGADGQLGTDLCKVIKGHDLILLTINDGDISNLDFVKKQLVQHKPRVIINTAAYVRVDDCEDNKDLAFQVNAVGARNMAVAAEDIGACYYISAPTMSSEEKSSSATFRIRSMTTPSRAIFTESPSLRARYW